MNPFQLSPSCGPLRSVELPDEQQTTLRTMRLIEDLRMLSAELDTGQWMSVSIVQSPDRLQVATYRAHSGTVAPLLAASLIEALEQMITAGELVRSRLSPEWRQRLLGAG